MSVLALLHIPSGWMGQSLNPEDAPRALVAGAAGEGEWAVHTRASWQRGPAEPFDCDLPPHQGQQAEPVCREADHLSGSL